MFFEHQAKKKKKERETYFVYLALFFFPLINYAVVMFCVLENHIQGCLFSSVCFMICAYVYIALYTAMFLNWGYRLIFPEEANKAERRRLNSKGN